MTTTARLEPVSQRGARLSDRYEREEGHVYLNGIQALVRLPLEQARRDRQVELRIGTFISGYPGSPLGGYDLALKQASTLMSGYDITLQPGQNEELAMTALMGTQMLDRYPHSRYDGVTGLWYGKGPGLDRSGDALRHANFAGTTANGAVVVLSGEDHEAKSSTLPYEQEYAFAHAGLPILYPSSVEEFVTYGLHAIAMSRYTGCYVAMKLVSSICDGGQTIDLDAARPPVVIPEFEVDGRPFRKWQDHAFFPGATIELERHVFTERHPAAVEYVRRNGLDRVVVKTGADRLGLLTAGKSYADTMQAFRDLGVTHQDLQSAGIRLIKLGAIYPVDAEFIRESTRDLDEVLVIEEKRGTLEGAVKEAVCNLSSGPRVYGKTTAEGRVLFPAYGGMDADVIAEALGPILRERMRGRIDITARLDLIQEVRSRDYEVMAKRSPNYCSGCPHNVSTKLLDDQVAWGAPGCHVFASILPEPRQIDAVFQLGGEGVAWIGLSPYTDMTHVFQNQGDGSFFHASQLNIRFAVAAGVTMTYKLLYNGYVANTGAQPRVGEKSVTDVVQMLALEGVSKIALIAKETSAYKGVKLPAVATVFGPEDIDDVLADLAATKGVTVFIYDGVCANERRRQQKRGKAPKPTEFVVINEDVCENCGHCGELTNCMSLHKKDTEFGPKTEIHQSSCNQDTSCLGGDCPSFITVHSAEGLKKPVPAQLELAELSEPAVPVLTESFHIYIPGVGGTGVLTLNSLLSWAALIDGHDVLSYDQTGAAQKWGAVLSSLVISPRGERAEANKIGLGKADLYLAVDPMAAADKVNLDRCIPQRTAALINTNLLPSGEMVRDSRNTVTLDPMVALIGRFTDVARSAWIDARGVAEGLFGDYMATNMVALGAAYQAGLLPLSAGAIEAAIELNGTAKQQNLQAFRYGRLAHAEPGRVDALIRPPAPTYESTRAKARAALMPALRGDYDVLLHRVAHLEHEDRRLLAVRIGELIQFQNAQYATEYVDFVCDIAQREADNLGSTSNLAVSREVIRNLYKLMAYKDEYEVARLHLRTAREQKVTGMFSGPIKVQYNLHPPVLRAMGMKKKLQIADCALNPAFRLLYAMRHVRGTTLDPCGHTHVRREERELVTWYRNLVSSAVAEMTFANRLGVVDIAALPDDIRGYEEIKMANAKVAKEQAEVLRGRLKSTIMLPIINLTPGK